MVSPTVSLCLSLAQVPPSTVSAKNLDVRVNVAKPVDFEYLFGGKGLPGLYVVALSTKIADQKYCYHQSRHKHFSSSVQETRLNILQLACQEVMDDTGLLLLLVTTTW